MNIKHALLAVLFLACGHWNESQTEPPPTKGDTTLCVPPTCYPDPPPPTLDSFGVLMPDITMCQGNGCPFKETCYRHIAKPSQFRQSWFTESPLNPHKKECEEYIRVNANGTRF